MIEVNHQWSIFHKGRMQVKACSNCGDLHLSSNTESQCSDKELTNTPIVRAGYLMLSEIDDNIENAA